MKLTYINNWEYDQYYVDKKPISDLKKISIGGIEYKVTARAVEKDYNDMGHSYTARSTHFFVKQKVLGVMMDLDLNSIVNKVPISALKYTFAKEEA
jgi:hypothetical protein